MSGAIWRMRVHGAEKTLGKKHPATYAARGRWISIVQTDKPRELDGTNPFIVAWARGTGSLAFNNRHTRKRIALARKKLGL